jgi:hypothetical protein
MNNSFAYFINSFGPYLWPLLIICLVTFILGVINGARLLRWNRHSYHRIDASINAILFWGVVAAVIGVLGQWSGIYKSLLVMAREGLSSPRAVWIGIAESSLTTILGLGILVVAGLLWFGLRSFRRWLVATAPAAAAEEKAGEPPTPGIVPVAARPIWLRIILVLVVIGVPVNLIPILIYGRYFTYGSRFIWPVTGVAVLALVIALAKMTTLSLRTTIEPLRQRRGLATMIFLAVTGLGLGWYGLIIETFLAARRIAADMEGINHYAARALIGSSATLVVSMLVAIAIGIMWYLLRSTVQRIERAEAVPASP